MSEKSLSELIAEVIQSTWAHGGIGKEASADSILSLISERIKKVENPYALQDGTAVPKWERYFDGFVACRQAMIKEIGEGK
jgi:hypothetical protein